MFLNLDPEIAVTLNAMPSPSYTGVTLHTSSQAIPIPLFWGTRRISPNVIWQTSLTTYPNTSPFNGYTLIENESARDYHGGTLVAYGTVPGDVAFHIKVTVNGSTDQGTHWWVPTILALCEGPIVDPKTLPNARVWTGGGAAPITWANSGGGVVYGVAVDTFVGDGAQTAWGFWSIVPPNIPLFPPSVNFNGILYGGMDLAYRFTAYIAYGLLNTGANNVIPQTSFEITRTPNSGSAFDDSYHFGTDYSAGEWP